MDGQRHRNPHTTASIRLFHGAAVQACCYTFHSERRVPGLRRHHFRSTSVPPLRELTVNQVGRQRGSSEEILATSLRNRPSSVILHIIDCLLHRTSAPRFCCSASSHTVDSLTAPSADFFLSTLVVYSNVSRRRHSHMASDSLGAPETRRSRPVCAPAFISSFASCFTDVLILLNILENFQNFP